MNDIKRIIKYGITGILTISLITVLGNHVNCQKNVFANGVDHNE